MRFFVFYFLFCSYSFAQNTQITSFGEAKSTLMKVYGHKNKTFYCDCPYQKKSIKLRKCNLKLKKYKKRSSRLEWEHIVPAHAFGQSFSQWRNSATICGYRKNKKGKKKKISSRKCARKNKLFSAMESDIYNLVPAVGSVNALRSNFSMAQLTSSEMEICPGVMKSKKKFMPADNKKGDVARIYLYMDQVYPGHGIISKKNTKLFQAWDKLDPVDKEECELAKRKQKYQGSVNPIMSQRCALLK